MKITALRCSVLSVPTGTTVSAAIGNFDTVSYLVLMLDTDTGHCGSGHIQVPGTFGLQALRALLADFRGLVLGRDPRDTAGFAQLCSRAAFWLGSSGLWSFVVSTLDVALWDLAGQAAGQPLHRLWGARRDAIGIYGSGRMWLAQSLESLVQDAADYATQGFKALKMRVGSPEMSRDLERVEAVRATIGPGVQLMVDCNQGLDLERAIRFAAALRPYDIAWLEEPLGLHDVEGYAQLRRRSDIPLATGENLYLPWEFDAFVQARAVDVLMPDLQRCGGYTGMNRIAEQCAQAGVRFSPHAYAWHSSHSVAAFSAEGLVEYMPRGDAMFARTTTLVDGQLRLPADPGTGLRYDPAWLAAHAAAA